MRIGTVAQQLNINSSKIRYYESLDLIRSTRQKNGYREYSGEMVQLLQLILQAKSLGFSLQEIRNMSHVFQAIGQEQGELRAYLEAKVKDLDQRIGELEAFKKNIFALLNAHCPL